MTIGDPSSGSTAEEIPGRTSAWAETRLGMADSRETAVRGKTTAPFSGRIPSFCKRNKSPLPGSAFEDGPHRRFLRRKGSPSMVLAELRSLERTVGGQTCVLRNLAVNGHSEHFAGNWGLGCAPHSSPNPSPSVSKISLRRTDTSPAQLAMPV